MIMAVIMTSCNQQPSTNEADKTTSELADTLLKPFTKDNLYWTREPKRYDITDSLITIETEPNTDLWQRTYYGFQNDNAPVLQMKTSRKFLSITVMPDFNSSALFD